MTRAEIRELVYAQSSDKQRLADESVVNSHINMALAQVASWVATNFPQHMLAEWTGAVENADGKPYVRIEMDDGPVREIVGARRTDVSDDSGDCEIVSFFQARTRRQNALRDNPLVFVYGGRVGFLEPKNGIAMQVQFVRSVHFMEQDDDEPGGTLTAMPNEYQILIPTYATILKLTSERLDSQDWRAIYSEQREQLLASTRRE